MRGVSAGNSRTTRQRLLTYRPWFYAAALYNLVWGTVNIVFPTALFDLLDLDHPNYLPLWQVVGMFVLVYAPAYWWAGRYPQRFPHLIVIGMLGKLLGPIGFAGAVLFSDFPIRFGVTILTNDLLWYPAFLGYLVNAARAGGGWRALLSGAASIPEP
jgi:small multidrug resistance pump